MANNSISNEFALRHNVGDRWFSDYNVMIEELGKIDFCVTPKHNGAELFDTEYFLWGESKLGKSDVNESFVQLILTIGKARTFDKHLPPMFLGAFDAEKFAFLPYNKIMDVFELNDFNWNVAPSDHGTKEFKLLEKRVEECLNSETLLFRYDENGEELRKFIRDNFILGKSSLSKIQINKNNFTHIYRKWLGEVKPTIDINWEEAKKEGLLDADFYLADILSDNNKSIKENLYVLLANDKYKYNIHRRPTGSLSFEEVEFTDGQVAHTRFWLRYIRPPKEEYWDYIVNRRDLLVPQDIRERKGSFFTPVKWVELSQEYIARELGENWQDEYYVWDCCAGTGNLLAGLTNKYNIYASTLDMADVKVMKELIKSNSINLLNEHVFQFDFLNDDFSKLPQSLLDIINDPEKRKKLVIYINPPYAEAATAKQRAGTGTNKANVARNNNIEKDYRALLGHAVNEIFAQFVIRIYQELPQTVLAEFSKLKILQAPYFRNFRNTFQAKLGQNFIVPANTFDNVTGQFPIGFFIWHTLEKKEFTNTITDVYDRDGNFIGTKNIYAYTGMKLLTDWMKTGHDNTNPRLAYLRMLSSDMQNQNGVFLTLTPSDNDFKERKICNITERNLIERCIYYSVRHCIEATWLNDRDQFLYPADSWKEDEEFQHDCLAYTLFHGQNRISSVGGTNHWIPFTEEEVRAKERFESHFMSEYIHGKRKPAHNAEDPDLFTPVADELNDNADKKPKAISFSPEAQAVMDAGKELWKYYHSQPKANPNASYYDIRLHFQGTNDKGKMNPDSADSTYTNLVKELRTRIKTLGRKIEPKVYEHGFLLR